MNDFIEFIAGVMNVDSSELNENTSYGTIDKWDSLMHMRLVMAIEEEYDVEIPIEDIPNIKSLKDFYNYIEA